MSHTASLAGNHEIVKSALAQAGVVEADDFKQLTDMCRSLAVSPPPQCTARPRVAIVTFSGGAGIVSSDFLDSLGLNVAELSEEARRKLEAIFPGWMPVSNPVDLWPAMEKHLASGRDMCSEALEAVLADPAVDAVLLHVFVARDLSAATWKTLPNRRTDRASRYSSGSWENAMRHFSFSRTPAGSGSPFSRNSIAPWSASAR